MKQLILATSNNGKIRELRKMFAALEIEIIPQSEFEVPDADETGLTFIENAILKARHASTLTNLPALADDSGICIDALNGAPGIRSARYAGDNANDVDLVNKVLAEMSEVPDDKRTAAFHCVLALVRHPEDPAPIVAVGYWPGTIIQEAQGKQGFGYDPIFFVAEQNCTAAELDPTLKNQISHRGLAMQALQKKLCV